MDAYSTHGDKAGHSRQHLHKLQSFRPLKAPETSTSSKILVISKQPMFSEDMIQYSLDMAAKRNAEIVALNLDEQERDFEKFQKQSRNNISAFLQKARKAGVCFSHMVCDGPEERVVEHLHAAIEGFSYVMDDVPALLGGDHTIPVYVHSE